MAYCEKSYPTKLAYTYLEEIAKEFEMQYGREVEQVERPYAFIKFGVSKPHLHRWVGLSFSHFLKSSAGRFWIAFGGDALCLLLF